MPKKITSLTNPAIKSVVRLRDRTSRNERSLTIVEGLRENLRALEAGLEINEIYYSEGFNIKALEEVAARSRVKDISFIETSLDVYRKISYGDRQEGALSVARIKTLDISELKADKNALLVVIEHVEKPGNLGAILRSCDGAGVKGVLICHEGTDLFNPNVIRASLGAVFTLNIVSTTNGSALAFLKEHALSIIATSPEAKDDYTTINADRPLALIVGSEKEGLSPFWVKAAEQVVRIPMNGKIDSLNVSASTAVVLYEINRQRTRSR